LEPLVVQPLQAALTHPLVAPYVTRVKPHLNNAVKATKPIILRTQAEWNARVLPQWNKRVVPQWNKHAAPRIRHVEKVLLPHRDRVALQYREHVVPRLNNLGNHLQRWQHDSQHYIVIAASKCHEAYQVAKPYAMPIWLRIEAALAQVLAVLQAQRHQFVDPHVARIWEKVKELSRVKPKGTSSVQSVTPTLSNAIPSSSSVDAVAQSSATPSELAHTPSAVPTSTQQSEEFQESTNSAPHIQSTTNQAVESTLEADVAPTAEETVQVFTIPETVEADPSTTPASSHETSLATSSNVISEEADAPSNESPVPVPAETTDGEANDEANLDLSAFLTDLGLNDEPPEDESPETPSSSQIKQAEDEAERYRQLVELTATQRADITKRHTEWEEKLDALVKAKRKDLRKTLVAMRKAAVDELKQSPQIRGQVDSFVAEAEKYIKGVEMSLKALIKENRGVDEKLSLWTRVISKVEDKFVAKTRETEAMANAWYAGILNKEIQEVRKPYFV
jgi:hypothetical protein